MEKHVRVKIESFVISHEKYRNESITISVSHLLLFENFREHLANCMYKNKWLFDKGKKNRKGKVQRKERRMQK